MLTVLTVGFIFSKVSKWFTMYPKTKIAAKVVVVRTAIIFIMLSTFELIFLTETMINLYILVSLILVSYCVISLKNTIEFFNNSFKHSQA